MIFTTLVTTGDNIDGKKGIAIKDTIIREVYSRVLDELLLKKEICDISTTEIIRESGLSRATFYKYFRDKYELLFWRYTEFLDSLANEYIKLSDSDDNLRGIVYYIHRNKAVFKKILRYTGQNSFNDHYIEFTFEVAQEVANKSGRTLSTKDHFIIHYHAAGILRTLNDWIQSDIDFGPDEICEIINGERSLAVKKLYVVQK